MPASERIDWSMSAVPRRVAFSLAVVQLYLVSTYLVGAVVPFLGRERAAPPGWLEAVWGLLFGAAGFWVTVAGAGLAWLAALGGGTWFAVRRRLSTRANAWLIGSTVACLLYAFWALTPAANVIRAWVLD